MVSVKSFILAGAVAVVSTAACAADMALPPPPIQYQPVPMVLEAPLGGWYLRGDVGVGVQTFSSFQHSQTNSAFVWPPSWNVVQQDIQDTSIFGLGVGYEFNNWLRFDITGEYRTKAGFRATGSYTDFCGTGGICFDVNTGNFSAAVFMANAYVDLGTWWCITPFIGAGIGGAYDMISGVQDNGIIAGGIDRFRLRTQCVEPEPGLEHPGRPDLQRQQQSENRPQLALSEHGIAGDRRCAMPEHGLMSGRLLHLAGHDLAGFPHRPALDAAAGRGSGGDADGAAAHVRAAAAVSADDAAADEPRLMRGG